MVDRLGATGANMTTGQGGKGETIGFGGKDGKGELGGFGGFGGGGDHYDAHLEQKVAAMQAALAVNAIDQATYGEEAGLLIGSPPHLLATTALFLPSFWLREA
eukprot:gene5821-21712_t